MDRRRRKKPALGLTEQLVLLTVGALVAVGRAWNGDLSRSRSPGWYLTAGVPQGRPAGSCAGSHRAHWGAVCLAHELAGRWSMVLGRADHGAAPGPRGAAV